MILTYKITIFTPFNSWKWYWKNLTEWLSHIIWIVHIFHFLILDRYQNFLRSAKQQNWATPHKEDSWVKLTWHNRNRGLGWGGCTFVWLLNCFCCPSREHLMYMEKSTLLLKDCNLILYARCSWLLGIEGSLACHTYSDTRHPASRFYF